MASKGQHEKYDKIDKRIQINQILLAWLHNSLQTDQRGYSAQSDDVR